MRILALDQATSISGMAVFEDSTLLRVQALNTGKLKDASQRKMAMSLALIEEMNIQMPDLVVMEDVSFQKNAASLIDLARLQGVILGWVYEHNKNVVIYKPSAWRKLLGFKQGSLVKRKDLKQQALDFVQEHYKLTVTEDEADAVCIGCAYALSNKEDTSNEDDH